MESGGVSGVRSHTSKAAPEGNVVDHGAIAQLVEHLHGMQGVRSSSLLGSIKQQLSVITGSFFLVCIGSIEQNVERD